MVVFVGAAVEEVSALTSNLHSSQSTISVEAKNGLIARMFDRLCTGNPRKCECWLTFQITDKRLAKWGKGPVPVGVGVLVFTTFAF